MGELADAIINGEFCQICGVYLEPGEEIVSDAGADHMPIDGSPYGTPVTCVDCYNS